MAEGGLSIAASEEPARVLVVDDTSVMRMKLRKAVQALGHTAEAAKDGQSALDLLAVEAFDAILLDIVMPGLDGFEVLMRLKADARLREIPVVVVSALDDEVDSVVRAIDLGAEDFLPKEFDPVLLRARLNASLAKKRYRDQELEYFRRIERLTTAAEVLESGRFNPQSLGIDDLVSQRDPIGRLASVFQGMAGEIYQRELKLKQTIDTFRGAIWVIVVGVIWGLTPSLSRIVMAEGAAPLGLMLWLNPLIAVIFVMMAVRNNAMPALTLKNIAFSFSWAVVSVVLLRLVMLNASVHIEAAVLSLVLTLQGFIVFGFSSVIGLDKASPRRLIGLAVGLVGVALVLWTELGSDGSLNLFWLLIALTVPLLLATEVMMMAGFRPKGLNDIGALAMMLVCANVIIIPWAILEGQAFPMDFLNPGKLELTIFLMAAVTCASYLLGFFVIRSAGAVFYSQTAYTMTIAGVIWGVVLLNETLSIFTWLAFAIIAVGMYLVEPKADKQELVIKRKF